MEVTEFDISSMCFICKDIFQEIERGIFLCTPLIYYYVFFLFISIISFLLEFPTTNHPLSYQRRHQMQQLDKGNKKKAFDRRDSGYSSNSSYIQQDARETYLQRKNSHM